MCDLFKEQEADENTKAMIEALELKQFKKSPFFNQVHEASKLSKKLIIRD